jgi:hypothetical protein
MIDNQASLFKLSLQQKSLQQKEELVLTSSSFSLSRHTAKVTHEKWLSNFSALLPCHNTTEQPQTEQQSRFWNFSSGSHKLPVWPIKTTIAKEAKGFYFATLHT